MPIAPPPRFACDDVEGGLAGWSGMNKVSVDSLFAHHVT